MAPSPSTRLCLDCRVELPASFSAQRKTCEECRLRRRRNSGAECMRAARAKAQVTRHCAVTECEVVVTGNWQRCQPHALEWKRAQANDLAKRWYARRRAAKIAAA